MRRICLALPTNRQCMATIELLYKEACYAASNFDVQVCLLIIDTSEPQALEKNATAVSHLPVSPNIEVVHLDESQQRQFLHTLCQRAGHESERLLELMLPQGVSYGACTNRAFLFAAALNCQTVHRRDSDCHYQVLHGDIIFPIHQELLSLGLMASTVSDASITRDLTESQTSQAVAMVAASFIGEMSVDIGEMQQLSADIYFDVVKLWAKKGATQAEQLELVAESFKGAGTEVFSADRATLGRADPMRVDMCNISFFGVQEVVPLPPAKDTIGSDYFLIHLVYHAELPAVVHNRHIDNFYTPERRTDQGFANYQRRFIKFMLSMPYFHRAYQLMAAAGPGALLDKQQRINSAEVCHIIESTLNIDTDHSHQVFDDIIRNYRLLGGRYQSVANQLVNEKNSLIERAKLDMQDYLFLSRNWMQLINLSKELGL
ncbi:DUF6271 family protein [Bowmanella denitrificans]|uniref:DUF6271 family protein n=1 Tax=Bowmanella denitrificans TaxID=366582 RepID=A0ABP3HBZ6_9ALTE